MNFREQLRKDLLDKEITNIVGRNIFMLHKPEEIQADTYIEYEIIRESYNDYYDGFNSSVDYNIQIDIFTKNSFTELAEKIIYVLLSKGYRYNYSNDLYDEGYYHWYGRFNYKLMIKRKE